MRSFHFPGRSPVYGRRAMCATSHPTASLTAIETLRAGGNAVDAAIAAAAVLAVVECPMTGIGGDCFAILMKPGQKKPIALSGAGRAPAAATAAWYASKGIKRIETTTVHAVTVPGAVDGWTRLLKDHGTMPLERLLAPAIALAEGGFVVAPRVAADWANGARKFTFCRGQAQPAEGRQGAQGRRRHAVSGACQDAEADRPGRARRLLQGRDRQGHGGGAERPGRLAHAWRTLRRSRRPM